MRVERSRAEPTAFARELFAQLPARYDVLAEVLSFGQNRRWRRVLVERLVADGPRRVLDVATGPAGVARLIAARSAADIVGVDVSPEMLGQGVANVRAAGLGDRIHVALARAEQLPFADATFDAVSFTYLLRYVADPAAVITELARVVRPGGVMAALDFGVPPRVAFRLAWWLYTRVVLPISGLATGGRAWFDVGRFLGPSIAAHERRYGLAWTVDAWRRAGLIDIEARRMSLGGGVVMWGRRA